MESKEARFGFSWESKAGKEASYKLESWGLVQRERLEGGIFPKAGYSSGRGSPSNLPDVFAHQMDVDITLGEWQDGRKDSLPWMHRLLQFVYRDGLDWVPFVHLDNGEKAEGLVEYVLWGGQKVQLAPDAEPPVNYAECRFEVRSRYQYDLDKFPCGELDRFVDAMYPNRGRRRWRYRRRLLERARFDFGEFLARRRKLGEFGEDNQTEAA